MRRWLATLAGLVVVALAGTAFAWAGSYGADRSDDTEAATVTTEAEKPSSHEIETPLDFESIPEGMLDEDDLPDPGDAPGLDAVDTTPPDIEILYPENGQVFEKREVVFEGITEPGARVYAGDREADVSEEGGWRIVLVLEKGENLVTITAVDASENHATDTVTVVYRAPEQPKEEPKEEPKDQPKEEPKEEPHEWEFSANQVYGECSESPPFDVFHGTGKPGSVIHVQSEYGNGQREVGGEGGWEIKVIFEGAPVGQTFAVTVYDDFGHEKVFEFTRTD
jgi:hypothetical protein